MKPVPESGLSFRPGIANQMEFIATSFWNHYSVIFVNFLASGTIVTDVY